MAKEKDFSRPRGAATRWLLLTMLALFTMAQGAWAEDITISSAAEWDAFASAVNSGTSYSGSTVTLAADITVTTMAGTGESTTFEGTFDGGNHTLTFNKTVSADNCAPFFALQNALVKDLKLAGTITTSAQFAASLSVLTFGTTSILNCHSTSTISSSRNGDGTHGGFVAINKDNATLNFSNCSFKGSMTGSNTYNNGGFVGWNDGTSITYTDCLFAPASVTMNATGSATFNRNGRNTFTRAYHTQIYGEPQGTRVYATASDVPNYDPYGATPVTAADGSTYYVPNIPEGMYADGSTFAINMPTTGTTTLDLTSMSDGFTFKVYDDGGSTSNYSESCSGTLTLTAPMGYVLQVTGTVTTESGGFDYLQVHDGSSTAATEFGRFLSSGQGTTTAITTCTTSGTAMTLYFYSDHSGQYAGLDLTVTLINPTDLAYAAISGINDAYLLTGEEIKPEPTVTDALGNVLTKDADYTLSWSGDGTTAGNYTVTATAIGDYYSGSISKEYTVKDYALTISTADDWNNFASSVSSGTTYSGEFVKLAADISVSTMAGTSEANSFQGTFEGDGHTLTLDITATEDNSGAFYAVNGATIKNLTTDGTVESSAKCASGLIGKVDGTVNITNCVSSVRIISTVNGDATNGGFVGNDYGTLTFTNCQFMGSLEGTNTEKCGGFVGWRQNAATVNIVNCYNTGSYLLQSTSECATFARNGVSSISNGYYLNPVDKTNWNQGKRLHTTESDVFGYNDFGASTVTANGNTYYVSNLPESMYADGSTYAINMPTTGTVNGTIPSGLTSFKVYDNGGSTGNYSDNCDGTLVLTAPEGYVLQVTGTVTMDNGWDYLQVHDGSSTSATQLGKFWSYLVGQSTAITTCVSSGTQMTLYFKSHVSNNYAGLDLTVTLINPTDLASAAISGINDAYLLTGEEIKPEPTVTDVLGNVLTKGTDYTLSWSGDGTTAGTYTVTATAIGDYYSGSISKEYSVKDAIVINSTDDWNTFATNVSGGNTYSGEFVKLGADITVSTMAGTSEANSFQGTFDGDGHTLTLDLSATTDNCAPFAMLKNATIQNLNIAGTINTSAKFGASIAAHTYGTTNIRNCHSSVEITGTVSGDGTHGGFVGVNEGSATLNFENCLFTGKMLGSNANSNGGFVGWNGGTAINYTACLFAPTQLTMVGDGTFNRHGNNTFTRCYYSQTFGEAQGTLATTEQLTSGELCYLLNGSTSEGTLAWYQSLGEDATPVLDKTHKVVYHVGEAYANPFSVTLNADPQNTGNRYGTFYSSVSNYQLPEGVTALKGTVSGETLTLSDIGGSIVPKGTAVILYSASETSATLTPTADEATEANTEGNNLNGKDVRTEVSSILQSGETMYVLGAKDTDSDGTAEMAFYKYTASHVAANKAYLVLDGSGVAQARAIRFVFDDATGISEVHGSGLTVQGSEGVYTLQGIRISPEAMQRGNVYIVNGKKMIKR